MLISPFNSKSCVVVIDSQQKLLNAVAGGDQILQRQKIVVQAMNLLGVDVLATEQSPDKLGPTVGELSELFSEKVKVIAKQAFSCFDSEEFKNRVFTREYKVMAVMGVEAHVCVQQTVFDLLANRMQPVVLYDTIASRKELDLQLAVECMRQAGALITSSEAFIFQQLKTAAHPRFREVAGLIK